MTHFVVKRYRPQRYHPQDANKQRGPTVWSMQTSRVSSSCQFCGALSRLWMWKGHGEKVQRCFCVFSRTDPCRCLCRWQQSQVLVYRCFEKRSPLCETSILPALSSFRDLSYLVFCDNSRTLYLEGGWNRVVSAFTLESESLYVGKKGLDALPACWMHNDLPNWFTLSRYLLFTPEKNCSLRTNVFCWLP